MLKNMIQKSIKIALVAFAATGVLLSQASAQGGLEGNELRRNIDQTSEELRLLISREDYAGAVEKANQLFALDSDNPAATIWKDYAENKMEGPSESRLQKLLGIDVDLNRAQEDSRLVADANPGGGPTFPPPSNDPVNNTQGSGTTPDSGTQNTGSNTTPFGNPDDSGTADPTNNTQSGTNTGGQTDPVTPVSPTPSPAAPTSSSSKSDGIFGFSIIQIILVVVIAIVGIGLIAFLLMRRGGKKEKADTNSQTTVQKPRSAIAGLDTTGPLNDSKANDGEVSDEITQIPMGDKKTSGDLTTRSDHVTRTDPKTTSDMKTSADSPTGKEEDLYDSLSASDGDVDSGVNFGGLAFDDDKETVPLDKNAVAEKERQKKAQKEADQAEDELSFSDVLFSESDETQNKAPEKPADEEIDPNEMSFNSMMFGDSNEQTADTVAQNPPPKSGNEPTDVIDLGADDEEEEEGEDSFNSLMFNDEETVAPGMGESNAPKGSDESKSDAGAESFSDIMFDPNQETVAPPGMGQSQPPKKKDETEAETQVLPGMADTRPLSNDQADEPTDSDKKKDDDDPIKL